MRAGAAAIAVALVCAVAGLGRATPFGLPFGLPFGSAADRSAGGSAGSAAVSPGSAASPASAAGSSAGGSDVVLPPLSSHVMDLAGALPEADILDLDAQLEGYRQRSGHAIVAVVVGPLGGEPIEDFAYRAFNTWKVGDAEHDDGILLVVAPSDRRVRIETGKGIGGALTDLQSNDILKTAVEPPLRAGNLRQALVAGTARIEAVLDADDAAGGHPHPQHATRGANAPGAASDPSGDGDGSLLWILLAGGGGLGLLILLYAKVPGTRGPLGAVFGVLFQVVRVLLWILTFGRGGGGGFGGGGGSGYSGGGGHSGGGGSSDAY